MKRLKNRKFVVLSENKDLHLLFPSDDEETNLIREIINSAGNSTKSEEFAIADSRCRSEFGYGIAEIVAYGDGGLDRFTKTNSIDSVHLSYRGIAANGKLEHKTVRSYKCFGGGDWRKRNGGIILHEDAASSWNCAMEVLGNPESLILIRVKNDNIFP